MGSFANTLFTILLGWIRTVASTIWSAATTEQGGSFVKWIGSHWIPLAIILCTTGMVCDLLVYLVRWRPLRVMKSFFTRNRSNNIEEAEDTADESLPFASSGYSVKAIMPETAMDEREQVEEDLSRWEYEEQGSGYSRETPGEEVLVTSAGYTVPPDSPYRRPAPPPRTDGVADDREDTTAESYRNEPRPVVPRRRRRLRVGSLFSDPEEDMQEFDAPQYLIDRKQAYHDPVYPSGWQKSEDDNDDTGLS